MTKTQAARGLRETRISDGVPRIVAAQPWVQALDLAFLPVMIQLADAADGELAYTGLDRAGEALLDELAVQWRADWYDDSLPVEKKRELVRSALDIRRTYGTRQAVERAMRMLAPAVRVVEWFEPGGSGVPGTFDLVTADRLTEELCGKIPYVLDRVKNARTHLRYWALERRAQGTVYAAAGVRSRPVVRVGNWERLETRAQGAAFGAAGVRSRMKNAVGNAVREKTRAAAELRGAAGMRSRAVVRVGNAVVVYTAARARECGAAGAVLRGTVRV